MLVCPLCRIALGPNEAVCPRDGRRGREAAPWPVPSTLRKRFQVLSLFAHGDSGSLYLADEPETGRHGLLKILAPPAKSQAAERKRLGRELLKQATLEAPHIATPSATGEVDDATWIFREQADGIALSVELAKTGALSREQTLTIAAQLASGLDALHRGGLLHRDIKPGHVLLRAPGAENPRALLIDTGVSTPLDVPDRGA